MPLTRRQFVASAAACTSVLGATCAAPPRTGLGVLLYSFGIRARAGKDRGFSDPLAFAEFCHARGAAGVQVALGTPDGEVEVRDSFGLTTRIQVPPDTETLKEIAKISRGRFYEAADSAKLEEIYAGLGTRLSSKQVKEEVTVAFAGGALLLVLLGSGLSMAWFGRPI